MKSYWIAATVVLLTAWPSCSKARSASLDQAKPEETPVQQSQSSSPSVITQASMAAQEPQVAKAAVPTEAAVKTAVVVSQPKGSYMLVELSNTLKAKKLKPGDKVKAQVSQDVIAHGKIIIPVETELVGHVTEVQVRDSENAESRLGIVFDKIALKHFHDINIQAVVQAVAAPAIRRSRVDQPSQMLPPSMMGGGGNSNGGTSPMGGLNNPSTGHGGINPSASSSVSASASPGNDTTAYPTAYTIKQSPANRADGSSAQLAIASNGKPLSVGMPQGVTGIKGLSLSSAPSANTPGPVIVSNTDNVKLEYGTQILLHVMSVETQK
jgi:hypothetical protein